MKKLYLCTCNKTIDQVLDFARIEKEMKGVFDKVEVVDDLCLKEGLEALKQSISSDDSIVIGACSSQLIGIPVKQGIRSELVAFVPLREQVAWVHAKEKNSATNKALVLLSDAAVRLDYIEPSSKFTETMVERILVIGGGIAGLKAASDLNRLGVDVTLLEPPGLRKESYLEQYQFVSDVKFLHDTLKSLQKTLSKVQRVQGTVEELSGQMGSYEVTWANVDGTTSSQEYGAIIVAVGAEHYLPEIAKKCRHGKSERTVPLQTLLNSTEEKRGRKDQSILVAVDPNNPITAVEGAHLLRSTRSLSLQGNTVFVAHSDIRTEDENLYRAARDSGVIFIRGSISRVKETDQGMTCRIENSLESLVREVTVDTIAVFPVIGPVNNTNEIATVLGLNRSESGFIEIRYSKMKPVQTSRRGVFVAGNAYMPMGLTDALSSAQNAALEAFKTVRLPLKRSGWIPVIDDEQCDLCKACLVACPNDALRVIDDRIVHFPAHCEFCGICVSACPTRAIEFQSHSKESWFARFETIAETHKRLEGKKPFTFVFACSECANASIDQAGFAGKEYPTGTYVIQFPCGGMVSPIEILKGLVVGAEQVILAHCPPGGCHHQTGDHLSELVVSFTRDMLQEIGQDPERVRATYMIAALPSKMQQEVGSHE
ncbi:MAG: hydrogenase iron-sulfur subunit [Candidatus Thorarchaeota archaeon]|jgi:heterodisulfide reductase subunit A